jgi:hypothetical protein
MPGIVWPPSGSLARVRLLTISANQLCMEPNEQQKHVDIFAKQLHKEFIRRVKDFNDRGLYRQKFLLPSPLVGLDFAIDFSYSDLITGVQSDSKRSATPVSSASSHEMAPADRSHPAFGCEHQTGNNVA